VLDLKPRVMEVIQALDLGEAHGLKSPEIGPRPFQVSGRFPKPNKSQVVISGSDQIGDGVYDWDLTDPTMVAIGRDCGDEFQFQVGSEVSSKPLGRCWHSDDFYG
jgi:hypothetical protein